MQQWERYAQRVENGDVIVSKYVRLAVERFRRDMKCQSTPPFPYHFDEQKAQNVIDWFPACLRHSIGEHAKDKFFLEDWQAFGVAMI